MSFNSRILLIVCLSFCLNACILNISAEDGGSVHMGAIDGALCSPCVIDTADAAGEAYYAVADEGFAFSHWEAGDMYCEPDGGNVCVVQAQSFGIDMIDQGRLPITAIFVEREEPVFSENAQDASGDNTESNSETLVSTPVFSGGAPSPDTFTGSEDPAVPKLASAPPVVKATPPQSSTDVAADVSADADTDIFPACQAPARVRQTTLDFGVDPLCVGGCQAGFCAELLTPAFCSRDCPDGYTDVAAGCAKNFYFRFPDVPSPKGDFCAGGRQYRPAFGSCFNCDTGYSILNIGGGVAAPWCFGGGCADGYSLKTVPGINFQQCVRGPCPTCFPPIIADTYTPGYTPVVSARLDCPEGENLHATGCYADCLPGYSSATKEGGVDGAGDGPMCAKNGCPAGMDDVAAVCKFPTRIFAPAGLPELPCPASSFRNDPSTGTNDTGPFSMIVFSDPQLHWVRDGAKPGDRDGKMCSNDKYDTECRDDAELEARLQVRAMNKVVDLGPWPNNPGGRHVDTPKGVIINGDLTAFFHDWEVRPFEKYYVKGSHKCPGDDVLQLPIFLGLGNHDYSNNLISEGWPADEFNEGKKAEEGCFTAGAHYIPGWRGNGCARRAADYIKGMVSCNTMESFPRGRVESFDVGSLAYSWNIGNYHFIQLNNYPTYEADEIGVTSAMEWLEDDLARAHNAGRKIVINLHDFGHHFRAQDFVETGYIPAVPCEPDCKPGETPKPAIKSKQNPNGEPNLAASGLDDFVSLLKVYETSVIALFSGHELNPALGFQGFIGVHGDGEDLLEDTNIPHFRGGHAGTGTRNNFLLVDFADDYFNVCPVRSLTGSPAWWIPELCRLTFFPQAPVLSQFGGPEVVQEGSRAAYTYTLINPDQSAVTFADGYPDCGNSGGEAVTTTADAGIFYCDFPDGPASPTVSLKVQNDDESNLLSKKVTIQNVAPTVSLDAVAEIEEGESAIVSGTITDPGLRDSFTLTVYWGEGENEIVEFPSGTTTFTLQHTYLDDNPSGTSSDFYPVTVSVEDSDGGVGNTARTSVKVKNIAPTLEASGSVIEENGIATVSGTIGDPGMLDTFTLVIDWGEGSPVQYNDLGGSTSFTKTHQYRDDNPTGTASDGYDIKVSLKDDDGGEATDNTTVTVNNVAPIVTAQGSVIDENSEATVSGTITDPGSLDTITLTIDWGEGGPIAYAYPPATNSFSESFRYLDDNPTGSSTDDYIIGVTATDDDSGVGETSTVVTTNNVAPVAAIDAITDEAGNVIGQDAGIALLALELGIQSSFTDIGSLDTHSTSYDWGDGTVNEGPATSPDSDTHAYLSKGTQTVNVTVTDDDTGADSVSNTIEVVDGGGAIKRVIKNLNACINDPNRASVSSKSVHYAIHQLGGHGHHQGHGKHHDHKHREDHEHSSWHDDDGDSEGHGKSHDDDQHGKGQDEDHHGHDKEHDQHHDHGKGHDDDHDGHGMGHGNHKKGHGHNHRYWHAHGGALQLFETEHWNASLAKIANAVGLLHLEHHVHDHGHDKHHGHHGHDKHHKHDEQNEHGGHHEQDEHHGHTGHFNGHHDGQKHHKHHKHHEDHQNPCEGTRITLSVQRSLLVLAAKSTVVLLVTDAEENATKPHELDQISQAKALIAEGDEWFATGFPVTAVSTYRSAIHKLSKSSWHGKKKGWPAHFD